MLQVAEAQEESVLWFHSIISVFLGGDLMCTQQGDVEGVPGIWLSV